MNWSWPYFFEYLTNGFMMRGAWTTVWLSVISMTIGLGLGVVAAVMKMYGNAAVRYIAEFYIWLFRGTPVLIQLIIIYTGLPQLGIRLNVVESAILGLALNEGAYLAEIIRAGIMSVDKGQNDAARSVGMTWRERMYLVILPQATRTIIPPLGNQFNGMLKTTSLASVISMEELMRNAQMLAQINFRVLEVYSVAAIWYLLLVSIWGLIQQRIEAHYEKALRPRRRDLARCREGAEEGDAEGRIGQDMTLVPPTDPQPPRSAMTDATLPDAPAPDQRRQKSLGAPIVIIEKVQKSFWRQPCAARRVDDDPQGRGGGDLRPVGQREIHAAALHRPAGNHRRWHNPRRRAPDGLSREERQARAAARRRSGAPAARPGHGVPELQPLSPCQRDREHHDGARPRPQTPPAPR